MNFHALILNLLIIVFFTMNCSYPERETEHSKNIDWARGIVWYQIFPDRFYNGNKSNDPTRAEVDWTENMPRWQIHPWTADWYKIQPWEKDKSENFYDVVFQRRFGGDLIGVIQKLDYLKKLGINAIYFNPIFEAESLHKYDGTSFHHIDDNFGPDPAADKRRITEAGENEDPASWIWTTADSTFLELIRQAHEKDIKIVIDGVFNHTGRAFFAFQDILKNQQQSPYAQWYDIKSWDDPATSNFEFDYKGWWGAKALPEFSEDVNGIVSGPREYIFAATRRWMDPNGDGDPADGVDGWRLDVAEEVAMPFWKEWNAHVKSINPTALTVAEIWGNASEWIQQKCFDNTMNYMFAYAVVDFFIDQKTRIDGPAFADRLMNIINIYGDSTASLLWNLTDSHDTDRLPSMIINPDRDYDRQASTRDNPDYNIRKPNAHDRMVQRQIVAFKMSFIGSPTIYYGNEAGMWGGDDPDDRKPMLWADLDYDTESRHPVPGKKRSADLNNFDHELYEYYQKVIQVRHQHPVLKYGDFQVVDDLISDNLVVFSRQFENQQALLIFNREWVEHDLIIPRKNMRASAYLDVLNDEKMYPEKGVLSLSIPARGSLILVSME